MRSSQITISGKKEVPDWAIEIACVSGCFEARELDVSIAGFKRIAGVNEVMVLNNNQVLKIIPVKGMNALQLLEAVEARAKQYFVLASR